MPLTRKIILHVGTEKTGTTSIQSILWEKRRLLIERGYLYPESLGSGPHMKLTACGLDYDQNDSLLKLLSINSESDHWRHIQRTYDLLISEIKSAAPSTIIISDEHINVKLDSVDKLKNLRRFLERFGVVARIIIYFRRQDFFFFSMMSEALKNAVFYVFNPENPLGTFLGIPYRYNYLEILKNFGNAFPNTDVCVRPYIDSLDYNAVEDFSETLALCDLGFGNLTYRQNPSLPHAICPPLLIIGSLAELRHESVLLSNWTDFIKITAKAFADRTIFIENTDRLKFLNRFKK